MGGGWGGGGYSRYLRDSHGLILPKNSIRVKPNLVVYVWSFKPSLNILNMITNQIFLALLSVEKIMVFPICINLPLQANQVLLVILPIFNIYPCKFGTGWGYENIGFVPSFSSTSTALVFHVLKVSSNISSHIINI